MAIINPTITEVDTNGGVRVVRWALLASGDVGSPIRLGRFNVTSFQIVGTPTALAINGSNDADAPANWSSLSDWAGASLGALSAPGFKTPRDMPVWVQPVLTTGTTITVQMTMHRADMGVMG